MKSEYQLNSAKEFTPEILQAIKTAFGDRPVKITIEALDTTNYKQNRSQASSSNSSKYKQEITDTILDVIFDQLSKKKK